MELRRKSDALKGRYRAENIAAMEAMLAAHRLQHEKGKEALLKETPRARTVRLLSATIPAVKFPKKPSPRRQSKRRHDVPPAARVFIINPATRQ